MCSVCVVAAEGATWLGENGQCHGRLCSGQWMCLLFLSVKKNKEKRGVYYFYRWKKKGEIRC